MTQLIAGMYDIQSQIGAGGAGIVYLANHIRLNKPVVLKADKRFLNTDIDSLRKEADLLKELKNNYIPQVYDFIQEDNTVYTVMEFIDGESFSQLLKKGMHFSQPQVIKWALQLLEALEYLHSFPPNGILHSDIKPANIMLRNNGSICLIDYNIALALGASGSAVVGFSHGYASPEHYSSFQCHDKGSNNRTIDARSDIYSLGATLYHILSGIRPADDPDKVKPLGSEICSPAVSRIIKKAMDANPEKRYQTAKEMILAIRGLVNNDEKLKKYKYRVLASCLFFSGLFFVGVYITFKDYTKAIKIESQGQTEEVEHYITLSKEEVEVGGTVEAVFHNGKYMYRSDSSLLWESDSPDVASIDSKGIITGISSGVATINGIYLGDYYTAQIVVKGDYLKKEDAAEEAIEDSVSFLESLKSEDISLTIGSDVFLENDSFVPMVSIQKNIYLKGDSDAVEMKTDDASVAYPIDNGAIQTGNAGDFILSVTYRDTVTKDFCYRVVKAPIESPLSIIPEYENILLSRTGEGNVEVTFAGRFPQHFELRAYHSAELMMRLTWGEFAPDDLKTTLYFESEASISGVSGTITILIYDTDNDEVYASKQIKVSVN